MAITTQSDSLQSVDADIPSNYSRLIARELGLSARELPRLLRKTDVDVTQLLKDDISSSLANSTSKAFG